jgi:hypothetical protein
MQAGATAASNYWLKANGNPGQRDCTKVKFKVRTQEIPALAVK